MSGFRRLTSASGRQRLWSTLNSGYMSLTSEPRTRRRTLLGQWLADLLISTLVAVPFVVPVLIERDALVRAVEFVDVWQFDSQPASDGGLRNWAAGQDDLQGFRVDALAKSQIVLRYLRDRRRGVAAPDWRRLGYVNPRLLSTDSSPVQDIDMPRSGPGWACVAAGSLVALVILVPRVNRAWYPGTPWKMPAARAWQVVVLVLLASVLLDVGGRWALQRDASPLTAADRVIPQLRGWSSWMAWCSVAVLGPALEEVLYRGCLFGRFRHHGYIASGAVLSALAFAAAHGVPVLMPKYFCNGLILAWICHRTGSLWAPLAVHAGWNVFALQKAMGI